MNKQSIYSYPYLSYRTKDYKTAKFILEIIPDVVGNEAVFHYQYSLNNETLSQLLLAGKLQVVVRGSCSETGTVLFAKAEAGQQRGILSAPSLSLLNDVVFVAYILACEDQPYKNPDTSKEWDNFEPMILKGNVLGETQPRTVTVTHPGDGSKSSIFSWIDDPTQKDSDPVTMTLTGDRIVFKLSPNQKRNFRKIQAYSESAVKSAYLVPALTQILTEMKLSSSSLSTEDKSSFTDTYSEKAWYKRIVVKYRQFFGENADPTSPNAFDPFSAAQKMLESPVGDLISFVVQQKKKEADDHD